MPKDEVETEEEVTEEEEEEEEEEEQERLEEDSIEGKHDEKNNNSENTTDLVIGIFNPESQNNGATISKHVENILDLKIFLLLAGYESNCPNAGIYLRGLNVDHYWFQNFIKDHEVSFEDHDEILGNTHSKTIGMILKQLQDTDERSMGHTLGKVIEAFLMERSVCILSQNRHNERQEEGKLFWNMGKAEKRFISASHRYGTER